MKRSKNKRFQKELWQVRLWEIRKIHRSTDAHAALHFLLLGSEMHAVALLHYVGESAAAVLMSAMRNQLMYEEKLLGEEHAEKRRLILRWARTFRVKARVNADRSLRRDQYQGNFIPNFVKDYCDPFHD